MLNYVVTRGIEKWKTDPAVIPERVSKAVPILSSEETIEPRSQVSSADSAIFFLKLIVKGSVWICLEKYVVLGLE